MPKKLRAHTAQSNRAQSRTPWLIHFFRRHRDDEPSEAVPARDYLDKCKVAARLLAVVKAVADTPPPAFAGGGKWEAMHDEMAGFYEARARRAAGWESTRRATSSSRPTTSRSTAAVSSTSSIAPTLGRTSCGRQGKQRKSRACGRMTRGCRPPDFLIQHAAN
jgi:hypothetical protein